MMSMMRNFVYTLFLIHRISSAQVPAGLTPPQPVGWTTNANYRTLPVTFEENHGQADADVRFISRSSRGILVLEQDAATVLLPQQAKSSSPPAAPPVTMRMTFPGAAAGTIVEGDGLLSGRTNYLGDYGKGGSITGIPNYERVWYRSLYPGVDLTFHGSRGVLEHDFVVAPRGDAAQIRIAFPGTRDTEIDAQGNLRIHVSGREVLLMRPRAYQESKGKRREIAASFARLSAREFGFKLGRYDRRRELIIDPNFATFLGGSARDLAYGIAVDANGSAYITGTTNSSDFPTTNGVLSQTLGNSAGFVTKLNAGGGLVYSTDADRPNAGFFSAGDSGSFSSRNIGHRIDRQRHRGGCDWERARHRRNPRLEQRRNGRSSVCGNGELRRIQCSSGGHRAGRRWGAELRRGRLHGRQR